MSNLPRIRNVRVVGDSNIEVTWEDRRRDQVNLIGWIATGGEILAPLGSAQVFATARVGEHGASIEWGDDEDLAIDAVHLAKIAAKQRALDAVELATWQTANNFSNVEAATLVGVSRSTWATYKSGKSKLPTTVAIIVRASQDDRSLIHALHRPSSKKRGRPKAVA